MIVKIDTANGDCAIIHDSNRQNNSLILPKINLEQLDEIDEKELRQYEIFMVFMSILEGHDERFSQFLKENEDFYKNKVIDLSKRMQLHDFKNDKQLKVVK